MKRNNSEVGLQSRGLVWSSPGSDFTVPVMGGEFIYINPYCIRGRGLKRTNQVEFEVKKAAQMKKIQKPKRKAIN